MAPSHHKGFSWLSVLFFIVVLVTLVGFIAPLTLYSRGGGSDRTKALSNAKSIAAGLLIFKGDTGAYPCDATRELLEKDNGIDFLPPEKDANAYLAQLIATNTLDSEKSFFAPGMPGAKEGDDIKGSPDKILERGENGFAYIMAENGAPLTDTSSFTPLVLAPVQAKGNKPTFDPGPYGDKCVVGLVDGSSVACEIDENGHAISPKGEDLFKTGPGSLFGTDTPFVAYPR